MRGLPRGSTSLRVIVCILLIGLPKPLLAQDNQGASADSSEDAITVNGWRLRELGVETDTGSRLGLSLRDTPPP